MSDEQIIELGTTAANLVNLDVPTPAAHKALEFITAALRVPDEDAVCTACRWRAAHAPDCPIQSPWPTRPAYPHEKPDWSNSEVTLFTAAYRVAVIARRKATGQ